MIATLGSLSIVVALGASVWIVIASIGNRDTGSTTALRTPVAVFGIAAFAAFVLLETAILAHDFSIAYVANNTALATPTLFLLAAAWAALEGSIVLWGLMLALFTVLVWRRLDAEDPLGVAALGVLGAVSVFWFGLMATVGNPFAVCTDVVNGFCADTSWWPLAETAAPVDGRGPNPLLQNHILMAVHPPMLYVGYVGLTVPYAFAMAALWRRDVGRVWLDRTHRWTLVSWIFLTFGIVLGGWWSYEVLGWGGYWAWDPVENAAILPWFAATAFLHSAIVQRRRGMLQAWNFLLVISTFALTIFGTFLTRSGVIASVHAFTQSTVGPVLLAFLGVVVVGSLALFASRARDVSQAPRLDALSSREGFILANNLLLTVFTFAVLFGTIYPLVVEAFSGDEVAVGRSFYDRAAVPLSLLLLLFIGLGAVAPWRVAKGEVLWKRLRFPTAAGFVAAAVIVILGVRSIGVIIAIGLAAFVIAAIIARFTAVVGARREGTMSAIRTVVGNDAGYWGGQLAHIGVALMAISLATTNGLAIRDSVAIDQGDTAVVGGYCLQYVEPFAFAEPNRDVSGVTVLVLDETCTRPLKELAPRINAYPGTGQPIGTPSVWTGFFDDVYLGIGGGNAATIQLNVFIFPFQWMLWAGGIVIVAGGLLAMLRKPTGVRRASDGTTHPERGTADV